MENHSSKATISLPLRLKILFLSHSFYPGIGGIETISCILATAFTEAGHEVHLLTKTADPHPGNRVFPFTVIRRPGYRRLFREYAWADIVFENNPCLRFSWIGLFFKRKSIIGLQTWISRGYGGIGWQDRLKFLFLKRALAIISCSNVIRQKYAPSSTVIGNPYNESIFKMIPHIPKTSDFLFLGRLVSDKGADVAIQAFYRLITEADGLNMADMTLTIVGDGPDREYLRYMVSEFGLEKNIVFTGALTGETLVNCLNRHRYMIVPSRWAEPFGIVALEGMACGCLPIVSNGGGLPDAVGQAGLLFKQADVDSLFSCIRRILGSPEEEKRIREAAPAHLAAFSSVDVSKRYLSLFEQVISNRNN